MLKNIAKDLSLLLAANNIIEFDECDAYRYGLELAISKIIMYTIIFIIALLTKTLLFSFLFSLMYVILRQYTGGYHCKSAEMCIVISVLIYLIAVFLYLLSLIHFGTEFKMMVLTPLTLISPLIVLFFSPIVTPNNPLTDDEKKKYHRNSVIISLVLSIVSCIALLKDINVIFYASAGSLTADAVLIILSLRRSKNEENCYESDSSNG